MPSAEQCEFCGHSLQPLYPVTLAGSRHSQMQRCSACHSSRVSPPFEEEDLNLYYQNDYFKAEPWEIAKARTLASDYWKKISPHLSSSKGSMLEVGSGFGFFAHLIAARTGSKIDAVEPNKACQTFMADHAFTGRMFSSLAEVPSDIKYNHIFCFHVVEHLQSLGDFLDSLAAVTAPGAQIWILSPNADSWTFARLVETWGWTCPSQHYQFLSQHIPASFFAAHGFTVDLSTDVQPATVHFPSYWRTRLFSIRQHLSQQIAVASRPVALVLKALRRATIKLAAAMEQNRPAAPLLAAERACSRIFPRRPFDELFLVLRRTS